MAVPSSILATLAQQPDLLRMIAAQMQQQQAADPRIQGAFDAVAEMQAQNPSGSTLGNAPPPANMLMNAAAMPQPRPEMDMPPVMSGAPPQMQLPANDPGVPMPMPRPGGESIQVGSGPPAMPGAGIAGSGPNPITAGSRILPFTPEQAAAAMGGGMPPGAAPPQMQGAPGMAGPVPAPPAGGGGGMPFGIPSGGGGYFQDTFIPALRDTLAGFGMGRTPQESIAMGARMGAAGRGERAQLAEERKAQNQTVAWLMQRGGMDPGTAMMVARNPAALTDVLKQVTQGNKPDLREVGGALYDVQNGRWITPPPGVGGTDLSLNPVYGRDEQGNPVVMQLGKNGQAVQTKMPEGVKVAPETSRVDLGTSWGVLDRNGNVISTIPKDIAGAEAAKAEGKLQGEAIANLPQTIASAEQMLATIDSVKNDPNRQIGTGMSAWTGMIPGTGARDFSAKVEQLKGKAFLEAFNSLKGGGAITEPEGQKATQAIARLDPYQSEEGFMSALNDLEDVVRAGIKRARERGGQAEAPSAAAPSGPVDYKTYFGGQ